ncbi:MAG: FAD-dependent oxidoreductase [Pseudomonadota bacterium]|nr:FAD-dependent oxidoreductase [Pseudomonadota bacterium]
MTNMKFDETYDVVVVGYGFAGAAAAIEAARTGAKVLVLEKAPDPGGISICSQGAICCTANSDEAFAYLTASNGGRIPDDVLRMIADGMAQAEEFLRDVANGSDAVITTRPRGGNYPFPHRETFYYSHVDAIPNFNAQAFFPHVKGRVGGPYLFRVLQMKLEQLGVEVRLSSPAQRLIYTTNREVRGVVAETPEGIRHFGAMRGVVLSSGGFEANEGMKQEYWQLMPVLTAANRFNTGDGIRMAQEVGADLWHMWHFHGSYGFRHPDPDYPYGIRVKRFPDWVPGEAGADMVGADMVDVPVAWILVNRDGKRFMNEQPPYLQDTGARPFEDMDTVTQRFRNIPAWLICDEEGRKLYPLGNPAYNDRNVNMEWSDDNLKEVEMGILKRADTLDELAEITGMPVDMLKETIVRWNAMTEARSDDEHGRPGGSMVPIATPPFYAGEIWPIVSNTQGGPKHDAQQRIIDVHGVPVPRLYAAGEMGSCFGHLYLAGGNIAECLISGWTAGRRVAVEQSTEAPA